MSKRFTLDSLPPAARQQAIVQLGAGNTTRGVPRGALQSNRKKFGNQRIEVNGQWFDSKWEAQRYGELLIMEREGIIRDLEVHVPFSLDVMAPGGQWVRIGAIIVDFRYWRHDASVVEDTKSRATRKHPLYVWKKDHFAAQYGLQIREIERNKPRSGGGEV